MVCGYSAANFGHAHPRLLSSAISQIKQLSFCTGGNTQARIDLEKNLGELVSNSTRRTDDVPQKVWLSSTGARAIEIAWKIAFANRPGRILRFDLSYHGRSLATGLISDTRRSLAIGSLGSLSEPGEDSDVVPFPKCGSSCIEECGECDASIAVAKKLLDHRCHEYSAMILEPAIGARGYHFASDRYYQRLVNLVRSYGLLVISDEIQMGLGRMGFMFASLEAGWNPDFIVLGKSLGGGITPISAVIGNATQMDKLPQGVESETFAANPLACRIALDALAILKDSNFLAMTREIGDEFRVLLKNLVPERVKVDGRGLATVVDLSCCLEKDAAKIAWDWVCQMRDQGLLVHLTGVQRDRVAIIPPLIIDREAMFRAGRILSSFWTNK